MHVRIVQNSTVALGLLAGVILAFAGRVQAETCQAPSVPITPETRAAATAAGIPPGLGCWDPKDANAGQAAGDAKLWLMQRATKGSNISCLNPQFAEKLKSFMQAVPGGPPLITSGYRSVAEQQAIINRGDGATRVTTPCGSYHPWGLAVDFNNNTGQQTTWMRANARSYGLTPIGAWDPNHFQAADGKSGQCGACNSSGVGVQAVPPGLSYTQDDVPPPSIINQWRPPPGYCLSSSEPIIVVPCSSLTQPTTPFQQSLQPISPSQIPQPTTTQPIPYIQSSSTLLQLLSGSNGTSGTGATGSSSTVVSDLLNALRGSSSTPATSTPGSVNLGTTTANPSAIPIPIQPVQYVQPIVQQFGAQETFTTTDLGSGALPPPPQAASSPVQQLLVSIKTVLLGMLGYLQRLGF